MSLRDVKKERTAEKFRAAIKRILNQQPVNRILQQKLREGKALKLNPTNVEKEAGLSYGSTKNHPGILREIDEHNKPKADNKVSTSKEKATTAELRKEIKELKKKLQEKTNDYDTLEDVNKKLHEYCRGMISALFEKIPQEQREGLFKEHINTDGDNVVPFHKG
ncbi:MAG: hypothetical protein ACRCVP_12800 [Shewanella xiamenensis]